MIEYDGIRARLLAVSEVTALVSEGAKARVYPVQMPQNPKLPALTYQRVSSVHDATHEGPDGVPWIRVQIDAWSDTYVGAKALARAVRRALDGYSGPVGDERIHVARLLTERDLFEPEARLYRVSQDYSVIYDEP